jgi:aarF domain-containing kinase
MTAELGSDWESLFVDFKRTPVASASIGQVHQATLKSTGQRVAVKVQFPGIKDSIASDLNNLSLLLRSAALLPKGLYLENTIKVMRRELEDECDYLKEAEACRRFKSLLKDDEYFEVPDVVDEASTGQVLTMEWMNGKPLSRTKNLSQETRNEVSP